MLGVSIRHVAIIGTGVVTTKDILPYAVSLPAQIIKLQFHELDTVIVKCRKNKKSV